MPIYEYECQRCGHHIEEIQKLNDPPPTVECNIKGKTCELRKIMTCARFKFMPGTVGGWGGWEEQETSLVRQVKGKNSSKYGEGIG